MDISIKQLESDLWGAADNLRANSTLTAAEYKDPILGLVFLRFVQNRYEDAKVSIEESLPINPRTGKKREVTKDDFVGAGSILLPEKAKYDYLAALPESENIAEAINNAMKLIEVEYPSLVGILPKNYQAFDSKLLRDLVRVFNKDAVKKAKGDVFGRIYEFFLMKFSMQGAGAQEGGEFFTPPSLVNLIVNFIQPDHGVVHDPACGAIRYVVLRSLRACSTTCRYATLRSPRAIASVTSPALTFVWPCPPRWVESSGAMSPARPISWVSSAPIDPAASRSRASDMRRSSNVAAVEQSLCLWGDCEVHCDPLFWWAGSVRIVEAAEVRVALLGEGGRALMRFR